MLPSILLPLADWPHAAQAESYAFWLAKQARSHIHALAVIDVKSFEIPVLGTADGFMPSVVSPPAAESKNLIDELTRLARERADHFAHICGQRMLPCSTEIRTGVPDDVIAREATAHDIVVMARAGYALASRSDAKWVDPLVCSVVRESVRPVLIAGKELPESGAVRTLMVAFDGSAHAVRSLTVASELAVAFALECSLVTIAPSEDAGLDTLLPAESYLYHHGVTPKKKVVVGLKTSELLCNLVTSAGADILIMGAYGHSPVREMLCGSTTERILSHCNTTVILQS